MRRLLFISTLLLLITSVLRAQDTSENNDRIRDKMTEFIRRRLDLNKDEIKKFTPVFHRYFKEWRSTLKDFKGNPDRLLLQQKLIDLRIRYRDEFKPIIGEQKSNKVFDEQQRFIQAVRQLRSDQRADIRTNRQRRAMKQ